MKTTYEAERLPDGRLTVVKVTKTPLDRALEWSDAPLTQYEAARYAAILNSVLHKDGVLLPGAICAVKIPGRTFYQLAYIQKDRGKTVRVFVWSVGLAQWRTEEVPRLCVFSTNRLTFDWLGIPAPTTAGVSQS